MDLTPLLGQLATGGLAGFAVGYAAKKLLKLALIVFGLFILAAGYLNYKGVIKVSMADVVSFAEENLRWLIGEMGGLLDFLASNAGFGAGFIGGLILGLKKG